MKRLLFILLVEVIIIFTCWLVVDIAFYIKHRKVCKNISSLIKVDYKDFKYMMHNYTKDIFNEFKIEGVFILTKDPYMSKYYYFTNYFTWRIFTICVRFSNINIK